jgi:SAM-dependent methyltransferase
MPHEHRVAGHLGVDADAYDRTIRTFIPQYDRMISTIVHWLDAGVPASGYVVDLGAGTGALSAAILEGLPEVRVQLVDVDPDMLRAGAQKCRVRRPVRPPAAASRRGSALRCRRRDPRAPPRRGQRAEKRELYGRDPRRARSPAGWCRRRHADPPGAGTAADAA